MGLLCGESCMILTLTILTDLCDGQTNMHCTSRSSVYRRTDGR